MKRRCYIWSGLLKRARGTVTRQNSWKWRTRSKKKAPSLSRPDFPTLCTSGAYLQMLQIELHVATKTAEILESIKALCQTSAHRRK